MNNRMRFARRGAALLAPAAIILACLAVLASCMSPTSSGESGSAGSLSLRASLAQSSAQVSALRLGLSGTPVKTAYPTGVDLTTITYTLTLTSASSAASPIDGGTSTTGSFATVTDIPPGTWTATVTATDSASVVVGRGSVSVAISGGTTTTATIDLAAPAGTGALSLSLDYGFAATAAATLTPINPSGSASSLALTAATSGSSYTASYSSSSVAAGEYRLQATLTDGTATQWGTEEIVYVLGGMTTSLSYSVPDSAWKSSTPSTPVMDIAPGYNVTYGNYVYVSWTGATGAASYDVSRSSDGGLSYTTLTSGLGSAVYGYTDVLGSTTGVTAIQYYYRVRANNGAVYSEVSAAAPMIILTVSTALSGGSVQVEGGAASGTFLRDAAAPIAFGGASWTGWVVTSGTADITKPTSYASAAICHTDATVEAQ